MRADSQAPSDEQLMERVQLEDHVAFAELYDRHARRAFWVARAVCQDIDRAEDAVQEGFLALWRRRDSFRPELGSFRSWAMRTVQNRAIDSLRTHSRPGQDVVDSHEETVVDPAAPPHDIVAARAERDGLRGLLGRLPPAQAEVIVLAFYGGLSHSEIAQQLSLPSGTVKGRMRLGLEKLRRRMEAADPGQVPR